MADTLSLGPPDTTILSAPPPFIPPEEELRRQFTTSQVLIEVLLIFSFCVVALIVLFGFVRSRSSNTLLRTISTTMLFPAITKLATFVPGLMSHSKYSNDLFALWTAFLAYLVAIVNNYSCFRLDDNEDRRTRLLADYIMPWGAIAISLFNILTVPQILVPVVVMFWMVIWAFRERRDALNCATRSSSGLVETTKVIYHFMKLQQKAITTTQTNDVEEGESPKNLCTPNYKFQYLVGVKEAAPLLNNHLFDDEIQDPVPAGSGFTPSRQLLPGYRSKIITLEDIINDQNYELQKVSPKDQYDKLKDTCLSFASFWLLLAKFAGHEVTTDVFDELIHLNSQGKIDDEQAKRTFDVIEVELGFLYDYLFTNNYAIYAKGLKYKLFHVWIVIIFFWLTLPLIVSYRPQEHNSVYFIIGTHVLDVGITRFVTITILLIELVHISLVFTSNWARVAYVCSYIRNRSWEKKIRGKFLQLAVKFAMWLSFLRGGHRERKVNQYSLVKSYNLIPPMMWIAYFIKGLNLMDVPKVGQSGLDQTTLHPSLMRAFIDTILKSVQTHSRKISNGTTSLAANQANNLIKTYVQKLDSHSHVILVWHIATHHLKDMELFDNSSEEDRQVASTASEYCAYLLAFIPKFLPDNGYIAQYAYDKAKKELQDEELSSNGNDYELEEQVSHSNEKSILGLARSLEKEIIKTRSDPWKLLAEFWTEMLLYVALSNDFEAIETHADFLCIGGQLITQLWALVNHAGCMRDPDVKPKTKTRQDE